MRKRTTSNIIHRMEGEFTVSDIVKRCKKKRSRINATVQYLKGKGEIVPVRRIMTGKRGRPAVVYVRSE